MKRKSQSLVLRRSMPEGPIFDEQARTRIRHHIDEQLRSSDLGFYRWPDMATLPEDIAFFGGDLDRSVSIRMRQIDVHARYRRCGRRLL
ncbi:hypothetical protein [Rhizobium laguerreae]|uniref:hypothetical protein n=1 Tax=Rhizobium laguerreae TaxID=1076926 RepID=UPI001C900171|nr:hypothetical protein [Rhizobium laguerreae]MBY3483309.1 hypothetical protein [Rhizobium laguerreae]